MKRPEQTNNIVELKPKASLLGFCKATADQTRLTILSILEQESFGVLELCDILSLKQSALSHHLKILTEAGLLIRRREGNSIFYSRNHQPEHELSELQQALYSAVEEIELDQVVLGKIHQLQRQRAEKSEQFFQEYLDRFSINQEMVAPISAYADQLQDMIQHELVNGSNRPDRVLEIGPGEGQFLARLAPLFKQVVALDNSQAMLDTARDYCQLNQLANVDMVFGDTQTETLDEGSYDVVVMNMVLHHNASPIELLKDSYRLLKPGGSLFLSELVSHQQDWVRESCGDLWLGFQPDDLGHMASQAGFESGNSHYLAQRNGFVVQIHKLVKSLN
jgi:ArsR family transcriptional regulator